MIQRTPELGRDEIMTVLAMADARLDGNSGDIAFLVRSFLEDAGREGITCQDALIILLANALAGMTNLARHIDPDDPHAVISQLRSRIEESL